MNSFASSARIYIIELSHQRHEKVAARTVMMRWAMLRGSTPQGTTQSKIGSLI